MAVTSLVSNVQSLGLIQPTPGTPLGIFSNYPDMILAGGALGPNALVNLILFQYVTQPGSTGLGYIGDPRLNKSTLVGGIYKLLANGDSFSLSSFALNVFVASSFMIDVDTLGDGVLVTIHVR